LRGDIVTNKQGALVNNVEPNSAAAKAGIEVGDIILMANNQEITDSSQLPRLVGQLGPNKAINLQIWRNGKTLNLAAVTSEANIDGVTLKIDDGTKNLKIVKRLGVTISQISDQKQLPSGLKYGLLVQNVSEAALSTGIMPGDIIIGIGNMPIKTLSEFIGTVNKYKPGTVVALKVVRVNGPQVWTMFIPMTVMAADNN